MDTGGQSLVSSRCLVALTINKANETSRPLTSTSRREAVLALQRACLLLARQAASHLAATTPSPPLSPRVGKACNARKAFVSRVLRGKMKIRFGVFLFVCLREKIKSGIVHWAAGEEVAAVVQAAPDGKYDVNAVREKRKKKACHALLIYLSPPLLAPRHANVQSQFSMCLESARGKCNIVCICSSECGGVSLVLSTTLTLPEDVSSPGVCLSVSIQTHSGCLGETRLRLGPPPNSPSIRTPG